MKEKALKSMRELSLTSFVKLKREKLISQSTLDSLLIPMQKWTGKKNFTEVKR